MVSSEVKRSLAEKFGKHANDTGSAAVQIAVINERIRQINGHLKQFPKDHHSRLGLLKLVGRRRRYLSYLRRTDVKNYGELAKQLQV
jgi:small subunit ribosomal protein S15